jgi:eukaryotic-like serine/threonine-protein kinase
MRSPMPKHISHYRIEGELGRGGMGIVYRAVDTRLGRAVAIKMLPAEATADPERNRRFVQEARAASALNHPHIVTIHDIDEAAGVTFIAMELVDGQPLDARIARGPLPLGEALEYAEQIAGALEAAHARGIVHRDIKPANIMITADGRAKVLDFGIAKLAQGGPSDATATGVGTGPGLIMGTAAYMSPEQAQGLPTDTRSDVFSFGAVLYEMLSGRRPFGGDTEIATITAILRDEPAPLRRARSELPAEVDALVSTCLAKDPAARPSAAALRTELARIRSALMRAPASGWRRPAVLAPVALVLVAAAAFGTWQAVQARRMRWVREVAMPEIERLQVTERSLSAMDLVRQVERYAPQEAAKVKRAWTLCTIVTEPAGALLEVRDYTDIDGRWRRLGTSPITDVPMPFGHFRLRITKDGYAPIELTTRSTGRQDIRLQPLAAAAAHAGMVFVPAATSTVGLQPPVALPDFWIDRHEVTNAAFKKFVDAGGYRDSKYWKHPFVLDGREISFADAIARFRDTTGRNAPAAWELGSVPDGQNELPVAGISWYEAAAYAEFAGGQLPTIYHWYVAAGSEDVYSDVLLFSNFDGRGAVRAGERRGLGPWGTFDMGGNVKEWCVNEANDGQRYILGGGWNEPSYRFKEPDARNPWHREPTFGVRVISTSAPLPPPVTARVSSVRRDVTKAVPVPAAEVEIYKHFYAYDKSPLHARIEGTDDSSEHWRRETVTYDAAYGGERITAYLFLPKGAAAPYKTIVLFPNAYARASASSAHLDYATFEFLIRSGRALIYPVYAATFERGGGKPPAGGSRDMYVAQAKDVLRTIDYLETRSELDMSTLAYFSISMGAYFAPIPLALDPRIKVAALAAGGLRYTVPQEVRPTNFLPLVKIPVLMIHGRDDFQVTPEEQRRFVELLGTPPEHKKHVQLEGGHVPNDIRLLFREALDWLDKYQGVPK